MYPYNYQDEDFFPDETPQKNPWIGIRNAIFAFIMIAALVGGLVYQASGVLPAILGYWQNDYRLVLTDVLTENCTEGTDTYSVSFQNQPQNDIICVCGVLDAQRSTASLDLILRDQNGAILHRVKFYGRDSGYFCEQFDLNEVLGEGAYSVSARPRFSRQTITRILFSVGDPEPQF